ncbi:MAG: GNAT family N-acetyltransferase [Woeseia sp.]|nr:GNAT family N-acetyltransferase [Woeseia sp.]NNE61114.1 GNAT family N-acetyltransferase [Woeseia sp.]NNL55717.1 GNAT family N-acetyltransferase [Woeseia sp.]
MGGEFPYNHDFSVTSRKAKFSIKKLPKQLRLDMRKALVRIFEKTKQGNRVLKSTYSMPEDLQHNMRSPSLSDNESEIIILHSVSELAEWRAEWERLWSVQSFRSVFQHFAWSEAWAKCFVAPDKLFVIVVKESGAQSRAHAILPMWVNADQEFSLLGEGSSDYQDLLCDVQTDDVDAVFLSMLGRLIESRPHWKRILFNELREDSILLRSLRRLAARNALPFVWIEKASSRCPVVLTNGRNEVIENILKKKSLRRHYNGMKKIPGFRYRRIDSPVEAKIVLNSLVDQHIARWAINGVPSLFEDQRNVEFYQKLIAIPNFFSLIHFSVIEIQNQIIATHFGFLKNGIFIWYKPTFDPNFDRSSPGEVLMYCMFQELKSSRLAEFDFTRGEESFKSRFATNVRQNYDFAAFASTFDRAKFSAVNYMRESDQQEGIIGHVGAFLKSIFRRLRRINEEFAMQGIRSIGSRLKGKFATSDLVKLVFSPDLPVQVPELADGLHFSCGAIDLILLGKISLLRPTYLSTSMLEKAVSRRKRGDRLLIIRNSAGMPVHFSWLCSRRDYEEKDRAREIPRTDSCEMVNIIKDSWTEAGKAQNDICSWALRYLATLGTRENRKTYFFCGSSDSVALGDAKNAGFRRAERQ